MIKTLYNLKVCHLLSRSIAGLQRRQPSYNKCLIIKELASSEKNMNILLPVYFQSHLPTVTIPTFAPNTSICSLSGPEITASNQTSKMLAPCPCLVHLSKAIWQPRKAAVPDKQGNWGSQRLPQQEQLQGLLSPLHLPPGNSTSGLSKRTATPTGLRAEACLQRRGAPEAHSSPKIQLPLHKPSLARSLIPTQA